MLYIYSLFSPHSFRDLTSIEMSKKDIYYSDKYTDEHFEYRHVMLPKDLAKLVPKTHLMSEAEWRNLGVQQSLGMNEERTLFIDLIQCRSILTLFLIARLDPLHAPRARAAHSAVQEAPDQVERIVKTSRPSQYLSQYHETLNA